MKQMQRCEELILQQSKTSYEMFWLLKSEAIILMLLFISVQNFLFAFLTSIFPKVEIWV